MILTVTPNPSLDRTYEIPALDRGAVLRATADRIDPGGKGVNVSRAVAAAGHRTLAVLPLGGPAGAALAGLLGAEGIEVAGVTVTGQTRSNISVAEPDGTLTKINATGPELTADESEALLAEVGARSAGADWIACCGSLPRGLAPEWYAALVARAHRAGARIALDTSGPSLTAALRERPDVVKPNAEELAQAVGRPLATVGDAVKAAEELREWGARAVLASLGADGQLLVDDGRRALRQRPASPPSAATSARAMPRSPVSWRRAERAYAHSPRRWRTARRPYNCPAARCRHRPTWTRRRSPRPTPSRSTAR